MYADREEHFRQFLTHPYTIRIPQFGPLPAPFARSGQAGQLLQLNQGRRSSAVWQQQRIFEEMLRTMDLARQDTAGSQADEIAELTEAYLRNHYAEEVTNTSLADALHFHYNYLARCMKRVYGLTPMEYLTDYRLEQAKLLLLKTEIPIAAIAERTGFECGLLLPAFQPQGRNLSAALPQAIFPLSMNALERKPGQGSWSIDSDSADFLAIFFQMGA